MAAHTTTWDRTFGSRTRGEAGSDSDYDLLVVLDDDAPAERPRLEAGYEVARPSGVAADVIPCRARTFDAKRDVAGSLAHRAAGEGVVVCER